MEKLMRKTLLENGDVPASELASMVEYQVYDAFNERYVVLKIVDNNYRSYMNNDNKYLVVSRAEAEKLGEPIEFEKKSEECW